MMTCKEIIDFLMRYLDGELAADESARFEEHLAICPPCVAYLQTYKESVRLGRSACVTGVDCQEVPEDLVQAILAARRLR